MSAEDILCVPAYSAAGAATMKGCQGIPLITRRSVGPGKQIVDASFELAEHVRLRTQNVVRLVEHVSVV